MGMEFRVIEYQNDVRNIREEIKSASFDFYRSLFVKLEDNCNETEIKILLQGLPTLRGRERKFRTTNQ